MVTVLEAPIGTPVYAALRDNLRQEIISGALRAGSRLTTAELATRYGVSQMPVREALQALQGEGLVTLLPHRGASVIALDARLVRNVYDIRGAIESLLARLSLPNLTDAAIAEMEDIQREFVSAVDKGGAIPVTPINQAFHRRLYGHSDNPHAQEIFERYSGLMQALRRQFGWNQQHLAAMSRDHEAMLDALRGRDADGLEKVVRSHATHSRDDLLARMGR